LEASANHAARLFESLTVFGVEGSGTPETEFTKLAYKKLVKKLGKPYPDSATACRGR
jgi:hypothetical protein